MTVKPPGSSLEIEIKRAGRRRERPLSIVHDRNGRSVPPSHRLDGGSSADTLQWEAGNAACLAKIYRLVHGSDAPISIVTAITYPDTLPVGDGPCQHLIDYFSDPERLRQRFPGDAAGPRASPSLPSRRSGERACRGSRANGPRPWNSCSTRCPRQSDPRRVQLIPPRPTVPISLGRWGPLPLRRGAANPRRRPERPGASRTASSRKCSDSIDLRTRLMSRTNPTSRPRSPAGEPGSGRPGPRLADAEARHLLGDDPRNPGLLVRRVVRRAERRIEERLGARSLDGPDHLHGPRQSAHPDRTGRRL